MKSTLSPTNQYGTSSLTYVYRSRKFNLFFHAALLDSIASGDQIALSASLIVGGIHVYMHWNYLFLLLFILTWQYPSVNEYRWSVRVHICLSGEFRMATHKLILEIWNETVVERWPQWSHVHVCAYINTRWQASNERESSKQAGNIFREERKRNSVSFLSFAIYGNCLLSLGRVK